jgi:hypothetical protein
MKGCLATVLLAVWVAGCAAPKVDTGVKIGFDLATINDRGLIGPPDGLRTVDYEFCIPQGDSYTRQVMLADPSVRFYPGSRGRIGCGKDQVLCIGSTGRPNWRGRLSELASLPYVEEIRRTFRE